MGKPCLNGINCKTSLDKTSLDKTSLDKTSLKILMQCRGIRIIYKASFFFIKVCLASTTYNGYIYKKVKGKCAYL